MDTNEKINENEEVLDNPDKETDAANDVKDTKEVKKEKKASDKEIKKLKSEIEKQKGEIEGLKAAASEAEDKYLRVAAEYDNFRRRSQKEREGIYSDAFADCVKQLLPLIDNLQRATQFTEADKVAEGVSMILGSLPEIFEKLGITAFGEAGDKFDPNIHNAVMHEEDPEKGEAEIISVFQPGYRLGDKIIRYAMVKVVN